MLKVILAGHTGLEKYLAASNLKRALEEERPDWTGNRVQVFDLEDCIEETGGGNAALYAGATPTSTQRVKWVQGMETSSTEDRRGTTVLRNCNDASRFGFQGV